MANQTYNEADVRTQLPGVDVEAVARALNGVATALGRTEPYVTATGTPGRRVFTLDTQIAEFVQGQAVQGRRGDNGRGGVNDFGFGS